MGNITLSEIANERGIWVEAGATLPKTERKRSLKTARGAPETLAEIYLSSSKKEE